MWQRFSPSSRRVLLQAQQEAVQERSAQVETEHLLLGLLREPLSVGAQVLQQRGVTGQRVHTELYTEGAPAEKEFLCCNFERMTARIRVDVEAAVVERVEKALWRKMREQSDKPELLLSAQLKGVLQLAARKAQPCGKQQNGAGAEEIDTEHLLLALLGAGNNRATEALQALGLDLKKVRAAVRKLKAGDE